MSNLTWPKNVSIILVEPQMGENIGAAARGMKNFGITDLRIINHRDGWPNEQAQAMSVGAVNIIDAAQLHNSLAEAIADLDIVYAASCQRRDLNKETIKSSALYEHAIAKQKAGANKFGIVFGRESSGLNNEEITLADNIVVIPTSDFSSLNLAQAICVICYELFSNEQKIIGGHEIISPTKELATKHEKSYFYEQLFSELQDKGFFKTEAKGKAMQLKIRHLFDRIDNLTTAELRTLHGIISSLVK